MSKEASLSPESVGQVPDVAITPLGVGAWLLQHARIILTGGAVGALIGIIIAMIGVGAVYRSTASFTAQHRGSAAGAALLAAQLGLTVGTSDGTLGAQFYGDLLTSRSILESVALSTVDDTSVAGPSDSRDVGALLRVRRRPESSYAERASAVLRKAITVRVNSKTSVVTLQVDTKIAGLSHHIAQRLVSLVDAFNQRTRNSQASAERQFSGTHLAEAKLALDSAEAELLSFYKQNRDYKGSPELLFTHDRLLRRVTLRQQVVSSLSSAFEQARIEEVRDTPVVTIVDQPNLPHRRHTGQVLSDIAAFAVSGIAIVILSLLGGEYLRAERRKGGVEYTRFLDAVGAISPRLREKLLSI